MSKLRQAQLTYEWLVKRHETMRDERLPLAMENESFMTPARPVPIRVGIVPFAVRGKPQGRKLRVRVATGSVTVLYGADPWQTPVEDMMVAGVDIYTHPRRILEPTSVWHKIRRGSDGKVISIDTVFSSTAPEGTGITPVLIAEIERTGNRWTIKQHVAGAHTLTFHLPLAASLAASPPEEETIPPGDTPPPDPVPELPGGSGSGDGSGDSDGSSSSEPPPDFPPSKSKIYRHGAEFVGAFMTEAPNVWLRDTVLIDTRYGQGHHLLSPEWKAIVAAGETIAVDALAQGEIPSNAIAWTRTGVVFAQAEEGVSSVAVTIAGRISADRWKKKTEAQYRQNARYWASAYNVKNQAP